VTLKGVTVEVLTSFSSFTNKVVSTLGECAEDGNGEFSEQK
jgi:hypothetical protein